MSQNRVLILAYHFPPENVVGGARPYRFYKYLPRFGYEPHVITAADVSLRPEFDAEQVRDPFFDERARDMGWQMERSVRKFLLPGVIGTQWAVRAYRAAERFVDEHPGDQVYVLSTFPPFGTHAAAWLLAKRRRVPWIADFRDPLARNPSLACLRKHSHAIYEWLEALFVRRADCVIANTDEAERLLRAEYPERASRIHLIWNGFDPELRIPALPIPNPDIRVLSHVGELYEGRTVAALVEVIGRLIASGRLSPSRFELRLVGPVEESCLPAADVTKASEAAGWLKIVPKQVPKLEAQHIAQTSQNLLIVQPHSAVQVPSKLFEYLQIGRPILAYVPRNSAIEGVLARSGIPYRCIYPDLSSDATDVAVLEFLGIDTTPVPPSAWFEETFDSARQTESLAKLIDSL
jgi:hypothetical protein